MELTNFHVSDDQVDQRFALEMVGRHLGRWGVTPIRVERFIDDDGHPLPESERRAILSEMESAGLNRFVDHVEQQYLRHREADNAVYRGQGVKDSALRRGDALDNRMLALAEAVKLDLSRKQVLAEQVQTEEQIAAFESRTPIDLSDFTRDELRALAIKKGMKTNVSWTKEDFISALDKVDAGIPADQTKSQVDDELASRSGVQTLEDLEKAEDAAEKKPAGGRRRR